MSKNLSRPGHHLLIPERYPVPSPLPGGVLVQWTSTLFILRSQNWGFATRMVSQPKVEEYWSKAYKNISPPLQIMYAVWVFMHFKYWEAIVKLWRGEGRPDQFPVVMRKRIWDGPEGRLCRENFMDAKAVLLHWVSFWSVPLQKKGTGRFLDEASRRPIHFPGS